MGGRWLVHSEAGYAIAESAVSPRSLILLLDAHALLWWLGDEPSLARPAHAAIADPANDVLVSAATVWELGIKRALGKVQVTASLGEAIDRAGFSGIPITLADAQTAATLPLHHRDPFDRMLVAQAGRLAATVVSRDRVFDAYGISRLTA